MNYWHTHDDGFEGKHTHVIDGSKVGHGHVRQADGLEVVEMLGGRYKQPKTPIQFGGMTVKLAVNGVVSRPTSKEVH